MEAQNPQQGQIIEISVDVPDGERPIGGSRVCGEAPCGFSDAGTGSTSARERAASMRKLLTVVVLCVIFMGVEVAGGIKANSLAILTDAAHLLSDVAAFAISLFSLWAAGWEATPRQSYGFFRIEILGALVSIQLIWLLTGIIVYEAIVRLINDSGEVEGFLMFLVAAFGLLVNIIMALLLGHDHVLATTINMLRSILEVLMESTPREIDATQLEKGLLDMEEVVAIHELHIWAITVGKVLLACHVKVTPEANADMVLNNVINYIKREYNISHVTIQIER
ncbi:hypothetical protein Tsubulata_048222 [Turnera subulata]|uniref:Cation efflux protein cytoplasmic domain-containing protein n=1 Tax=Turnera subulata TaxID=218843 RepID=A0A9Q0FHE5_9ROSI|nr:hypothetical protein Tsubulata_048222 [Turnera subulata]